MIPIYKVKLIIPTSQAPHRGKRANMGKSNSHIIKGSADTGQYRIVQQEVGKDPRMFNLLPF